jgi:hypothetical protein
MALTQQQAEADAHAFGHMSQATYNAYKVISDILGVPSFKAPMHIYRSTDQYTLTELWEGHNEVLSSTVDEDINKAGSWINGLFPRREYKGGVSGTLIRYVFESQVMDKAISRHPFSLLESKKETEQWAIAFYGTSFRISVESLMGVNGQDILARHCRQMERCALDTEARDVLMTIIEHGVVRHLDGYQLPMPMNRWLAAMAQRAAWFGGYQKGRNGAARIESFAKQAVLTQGKKGLLPCKGASPLSETPLIVCVLRDLALILIG